MSQYSAPVDELLFSLYHLANMDRIGELKPFTEATPDLVAAVIEEAGKFASTVLSPINHSGDVEGAAFDNGEVKCASGWSSAYEAFVANGWNSLPFNPDFGGQGLPWVLSTVVQEIWAASNMAFALCPLLTQGAIEAIEHHASQELKDQYLQKLVSGEWTGTMNLTEPQAGSDLSAISTIAEPEDDHYRLKGQKIFITYGDHDMAPNIIHLVLARLPDAPEGVKGISLFVVPKFLLDTNGGVGNRNDVTCVSLEHKLGIHASPTAVMSFGDKEGAIGYLVGDKHCGLKYMFTMMNVARNAVGVEGLAIAEMAYQKATSYAKERIQGKDILNPGGSRVAIVNHPDVQRMLMRMRSLTQAMRGLALVAASAYDRFRYGSDQGERGDYGKQLEFLTPIVKGWCTEMGNEVASLGVQIHGGMGYIEETGAAQYFRDARITTIYEGTSGIQAVDLLGRKLLRDKGDVCFLLIEQMKNQLNSSIISEEDKRLVSDAIDALLEVSHWMISQGTDSMQKAARSAFSYMMMWGYIYGATQMAQSGHLAQLMLEEGSENHVFLKNKIKTSRFYIRHVLPSYRGYASSIVEGSGDEIYLEASEY